MDVHGCPRAGGPCAGHVKQWDIPRETKRDKPRTSLPAVDDARAQKGFGEAGGTGLRTVEDAAIAVNPWWRRMVIEPCVRWAVGPKLCPEGRVRPRSKVDAPEHGIGGEDSDLGWDCRKGPNGGRLGELGHRLQVGGELGEGLGREARQQPDPG